MTVPVAIHRSRWIHCVQKDLETVMTLFGELVNSSNNRNSSSQIPGLQKLLKAGAAVIAVLFFCLIFFNYIA